MRLHPRHTQVAQARLAVSDAILKAADVYGLTSIEVVVILAQLQASYVVFPLREERHPDDPSKKADEE